VGIFLERKDSCGDHGLGRLVEVRFKAPPGTTSSSITTHTPSGQRNCASWASQPQKSVTVVTVLPCPGGRTTKPTKRTCWWHWGKEKIKFCLLFKRRKQVFLIYSLLPIRWSPKEITLYRALVSAVFGGFRKIAKKRLLASSCESVCPSVRIEQLGPHGTDFHGIRYLRIFRKCVEKIQVSFFFLNILLTVHFNLFIY